ncbi:glycerophosphodiester phosphodiesterase family protein [Rhizobium leguminosarum]|uniref:glycerophosphodiester phosphodiesterase family protein n=1 Tax=Rhizobium leguminosarum TaxID=384 RepID=UPI001C98A93D|nr:glycerophosphodiester phosphodiesterase family protein [Rhizobium leguminosarum]MBY5591964.1 glycerophosphodiester phosphodiesterase family protein [Rhizobium leguminosarum]MBY5605904.1 glycerophosphodiester phosphodiesterase family protein [Rhizobium leguminosarum]
MKYIDHIADPSRSCAIVAHRGAWHLAPENSLAAIENAIAAGYDIVEVDIRQSADGHLFILHDDTLERMAGIDRVPEEMTIAEITSLRLRMADGGPDKEMTAHTIPTLDQVLDTIRGRIFVDLDLKDPEMMDIVAAKVKEMGVADQVDLKADSGTWEQRAWIAGKTGIDGVPFMGKAFFRKENADETAEGIISVSPFMCEAKFDQLETLAGQHDRLKEAGISLWVNTLDPVSCCGFTDSAALRDPDAIWGRMIDAGVSVIQTDEPAALKAYLKARRA